MEKFDGRLYKQHHSHITEKRNKFRTCVDSERVCDADESWAPVMAARPKERKLKAALLRRARAELGTSATIADFVAGWVEDGRTISDLARSMEAEMGESCSRSWLSGVLNRAPEDKARITAARAEAAYALVEQALEIADEPADSTVDVQRNRLRAETRNRIAGWWNRDFCGEQRAQVNVSIGQLHLDALRARAVHRNSAAEPPLVLTPNPPLLLCPGEDVE